MEGCGNSAHTRKFPRLIETNFRVGHQIRGLLSFPRDIPRWYASCLPVGQAGVLFRAPQTKGEWETMRKASTMCLATCLGATLWLAAASRAEALPEWARKYKTSCVTCHEAFPSLNAVGEAF